MCDLQSWECITYADNQLMKECGNIKMEHSEELFNKIKSQDIEGIQTLINSGVNINEFNHHCNNYPLISALKLMKTKVVEYFIDKNCDTNVCGQNEDSKTALSWASVNNYKEIVKMLINNGANINKVNPDGNTALAHAIHHKRSDIAKYLVEVNASVSKVGQGGRTPLSWAVQNGDTSMIEYLLNNGGEFTIHSALLDAIERQNLKIVQLLRTKGAHLNINHKNGYTPLTYSIKLGNVEIVKDLVNNGANVNMIDYNGNVPVIESIQMNNNEIAKILINNGANLNVIDKNEHSPLSKAVEMENFHILKYLVEKGANPKSCKKNLLSMAVADGNVNIFGYLVESGDINVRLAISEIQKIKQINEDFAVYLEILKGKMNYLGIDATTGIRSLQIERTSNTAISLSKTTINSGGSAQSASTSSASNGPIHFRGCSGITINVHNYNK